jgi:hypothetical protein
VTDIVRAKEIGMFVSKLVRSSTIVALLALGLAACSDGLTAPQQSSGFDPGEALLAKGSSGSGSGSGSSGKPGRGLDAGTRTFTIFPGLPVFEKFGDHILTMPANVVCDPARSGYGSAYWDAPCPRTWKPIKVTATWGISNGQPVISFSPDLRFAPSNNEDQWVELMLRDPRGLKPEMYYTILWFDAAANRWVDESQTDPTLKARALGGNFVARRLKHFSYYSLWVGLGSYNVTSGMGGDVRDLGGW